MTRGQRFCFLLPFLLLVVPFLVGPVFYGFAASFTDYSPFTRHPRVIGLATYRRILSDPLFAGSVRTVVIFALVAIPVELGLGVAVAWLLRAPFRGRGLVRALLLLPWLVSPVANGVMWHFLFESTAGIPGFFLSLVGLPLRPSPLGVRGLALPATLLTEIWRVTPLVTFLVLPGLEAIPRAAWEQATLDGASPGQRVRHVGLPFLRPVLFAVTTLLVGTALGAFDGILILTHGGPGTETLTPALYSYQKAFQVNNWPVGASSAWLIAAAVIVAGGVSVLFARRGEAA